MHHSLYWATAVACGAAMPAAWAQADATPSTTITTTLPVVEIKASSTPALPAAQRASSLATGSAGSTMDTPFSVSSMPTEDLRAQGGTSLQDALRNVPGVQADSGFNGAHTQFFSIRGAIADSGTGSNRVLRDGVRLSNYPFVRAFIDSVDVLRGPGAALGVRSEPGGTVNLVTQQPQLANFGSATLGAGASSAREASVDLNRVLSAEHALAVRLIATHSAASEWRHVPDKLDGLKLGVAQSDGDRHHLRAGVELTNQRYRPDYGVPALGGRPVAVPLDRQFGEPWADSTTRNRIVDLHGDVALGDATRLNVDYTHLQATSTSLKSFITGAPKPVTSTTPFGTFGRGAAWEPGTDRQIDSLAASLTSTQVQGGVTHRLFGGIDYYKETLHQPSLAIPASSSPNINVFTPVWGRVTPPAPGVVLASGLTTQNLESVALSAQDQIDMGAWTLVAGLRYTQQKFVYGAVGTQPVDESRWSPKLGALYRLSDADSVYANVATGMAPNQVASSSNQSLPSRRSAQVELGWKSLWQGGKLVSDVAVYRLDQRNMISADQSTPNNNFDFTVDGSGRSQGLEASLSGDVNERLSVRAAYAYTHARVLDNSVFAGKTVPNVAAQTLSLWGHYRWAMASDVQWRTGVGVYAQGARYADRANTVVLPGYVRLDLTHSWRKPLGAGESLELQLAVHNLLDKAYYVSSHLHVSTWIMPGEGRRVSVMGRYHF